uniref:Leucine-rich repeat-containing protein 23 n=1 Tax=Salvator merianae TaxID=96440 RepID=A0A8D0E0T2_SALMN
MKEGLSLLCKTGNGLAHAFVKLEAREKELTDITLIQSFIHLRYVDLSDNLLRDLSPLACLTHLLWLKVDNNQLTSASMDELPYLQIASFASNHIKNTDGINHPRLTSLNLKGNEIELITGLDPEKLSNLHTLELRGNNIKSTAGLYLPKLKNLYLAQNSITHLEGLEDLGQLTTLHLRDNQLETLNGFAESMKSLQYINLRVYHILQELMKPLMAKINLQVWLFVSWRGVIPDEARGNAIGQIQELAKLHVLPMLRALVLLENPCSDEGDYRMEALVLLPRLERLDKDFFDEDERTEADDIRRQRREEELELEREKEREEEEDEEEVEVKHKEEHHEKQ